VPVCAQADDATITAAPTPHITLLINFNFMILLAGVLPRRILPTPLADRSDRTERRRSPLGSPHGMLVMNVCRNGTDGTDLHKRH
jgi:hypothetical protein